VARGSDTPRRRSHAERERARAERAARRAGKPLPPRDPELEPPPPPQPARAPRRARRPPAPRSRGPHNRWVRRFGAVIALGVLILALLAINKTFQPFHGRGGEAVAVTVPEGADAGAIGEVLAARGVVDSGTFFEINATLTGRRGRLRPGDYTLRAGMSYGDAIEALTQGPKVRVVPTFSVTVPEGLSIREAAPAVDKSPVTGRYAKAARSERVIRFARRLGFRGVKSPEGFLFPATYSLQNPSPARDLVKKQLQAFEENFTGLDLRYAKRKKLTRYDVLIIASMVEREAQLDKERPLVAAVIYNRLKAGMALGIDATIRYQTRNWRRPIRQSELDAVTPYNTRKVLGLPPTPIGNPGLASLKAAANPAREDYLFYVVKPGACGEHNFSSTDAEFARDLEAYESARERAGGKSPTTC
jgi:uncharacterized YceG family protein